MTKKKVVKDIKKAVHKSDVKTKKETKLKVALTLEQLTESLTRIEQKISQFDSLKDKVAFPDPVEGSQEVTVSMDDLFEFFDVVDRVRRVYIGKLMFAACEQELKPAFNGEIKIPTPPRSRFNGTFKRSTAGGQVSAPTVKTSMPTLMETKEAVAAALPADPSSVLETSHATSVVSEPVKLESLKEVARLMNAANENLGEE